MTKDIKAIAIGAVCIYVFIHVWIFVSPYACRLIALTLPFWDCSLGADTYFAPAPIIIMALLAWFIVWICKDIGQSVISKGKSDG